MNLRYHALDPASHSTNFLPRLTFFPADSDQRWLIDLLVGFFLAKITLFLYVIKKRKKVSVCLLQERSISYFFLMCISSCTAIPHDSRVNATGYIPLDIVWRISETFTLFAYSANITGKMARIMTVLYFEILDSPCFCSIWLLMSNR